ncbi:MAG: DUF6569 family protein [Planctomycetota bacterium]
MEHGAMMQHAWRFLVIVILLGLLGLMVGLPGQTAAEPSDPGGLGDPSETVETVFEEGEAHTISGPYTHGNLAVYLVHAEQRDDRDFITLNEGLKTGEVIVSEKDSAEVRQLMIENRSDKPLYLQEGDRLVGGKQDRTVRSSIAIAPKSGRMPIPTFCIERSRWSAGSRGALFAESGNTGLALKDVRRAAKLSQSQARVWQEVDRIKAESEYSLGTANSNTSLNETLDSKQVKTLSKEVTDKLGRIANEHDDAVGVAFAVNGRIEEINVYPGNTLFDKVYPRLLESYAVEAALQKPDAEQEDVEADPRPSKEPPTTEAVKAFMSAKPGDRIRRDRINAYNDLDVYWAEGRATCVTKYEGSALHRQWLRSDKPTRHHRDELRNRIQQRLNADPEGFNIGNFDPAPRQRGRESENPAAENPTDRPTPDE